MCNSNKSAYNIINVISAVLINAMYNIIIHAKQRLNFFQSTKEYNNNSIYVYIH